MARPTLPPWLRGLTGLAVLAVLAQVALVVLLAWPAGQMRLHKAPLVVAGPQVIADVARATLESGSPGTWAITVVETDADARRAVLERRAYGALVITNDGLTLLVASAASPTIAQQLGQAVDQIQARAQGTVLTVEDLAPSPRHDARGAGLAQGLLGVIAASAAFGVLVVRRLRTVRERLVALIGFGVLAGPGGTLALQGVLGVLDGPVLATAGVLALVASAAAAVPVAFGVVADLPGAILGAVLVVPLGYPISGVATAPELVPDPWSTIGGLLPAGAGGTALRSTAFFAGHGATGALGVLAGWVAVALLAVAWPWVSARMAARRTDDAVSSAKEPTPTPAGQSLDA